MAASRSGAGPYSRIRAIGSPSSIATNMLDERQFDGDDGPFEQTAGNSAQKFHSRADSRKKLLGALLVEQLLLVVVPDVPFLVDAAQLAALGQTLQGRVELRGQRFLILAKRDGIVAGIRRRADELQLRPRLGDSTWRSARSSSTASSRPSSRSRYGST